MIKKIKMGKKLEKLEKNSYESYIDLLTSKKLMKYSLLTLGIGVLATILPEFYVNGNNDEFFRLQLFGTKTTLLGIGLSLPSVACYLYNYNCFEKSKYLLDKELRKEEDKNPNKNNLGNHLIEVKPILSLLEEKLN